jgi:hypothetical protein
MRTIALLLAMLALSSCASTAVKPEEAAKLNYGAAPAQPEEDAKAYFETRLKDPRSAEYRFKKPFRGYTREIPISGGGVRTAGWVMITQVNAKNGFGGYTGWKTYRLFFKDGKLLGEFDGNDWYSEPWLKGYVDFENLPKE